MKKLITAILVFITCPLTYIGGYYVVKFSGVPEAVAGFLAVLGSFVIIFQVIMSMLLFLSAYRELWKDSIFGYEDPNKPKSRY